MMFQRREMQFRDSVLVRVLMMLSLLMSASGLMVSCQAAPSAPGAWEPAGWGGGGLFWSAVFDPTRPGVIYMGGDVAGVYKTDDNGRHWRLINNGLSSYAVYSLAVAPSVPNLVYAGTTGGVCRSTDGGEHWQALPETVKLGINAQREKSVRALAVDPRDGNVVYAGTPAGKIFKTADGGQTWRQVYECLPVGQVSAVAVSPRRPATVLAATTNGVILSRDGGATWKNAVGPGSAASVAIAPTDPNIFYAGAGNVYKSTDGGETWNACGAGIDPKAPVVEVAVSPKNAQTVCCIATQGWSGHFYASADGGQTWKETNRLRADIDADPTLPEEAEIKNAGTEPLSKPTNLAISPVDPAQMIIAANWRPCVSEDGGRSWSERDHGADISVVYDIRFSGPRVYAGAMDEGVLTSADGGAHWRQLWPRAWDKNLSGHDWRLAVWNQGATDRILSTCSPWDAPGDRVVISEDGGKTFSVVSDGLPETRPTANTMWGQGYLRALAPDPHHPNVVYAGIDGDVAAGKSAGGIFKSEDGGLHWKALPNQPPSRRMFFALAVDPTDSRRLYWGTCGADGGLYRSDDAGASWTRVFQQETWIFNVLVTPSGVIYCPGQNLWRSADHGQTWTQLTHGSDGQIVGLEVDPRDEKTLWISSTTWDESDHGWVHKTVDSGATWTDITANLPYRKPLILRFNPAANELWAGGVGLFKIKQ